MRSGRVKNTVNERRVSRKLKPRAKQTAPLRTKLLKMRPMMCRGTFHNRRLIDLPEIEDCIRTIGKRTLRNGEVREVKRTASEMNEDYRYLVLGQAFYISAYLFSYLPTVQTVQVGGYISAAFCY